MTPGLIERLEAAGEHTPGPWEVVVQPFADPDAKGNTVYSVEGYGIGRIWDENGNPENYANARLIAAAPDLLEVLIEALPYVESCEYDNGYKPGAVAKVVRNMNAAILKARATQEQG